MTGFSNPTGGPDRAVAAASGGALPREDYHSQAVRELLGAKAEVFVSVSRWRSPPEKEGPEGVRPGRRKPRRREARVQIRQLHPGSFPFATKGVRRARRRERPFAAGEIPRSFFEQVAAEENRRRLAALSDAGKRIEAAERYLDSFGGLAREKGSAPPLSKGGAGLAAALEKKVLSNAPARALAARTSSRRDLWLVLGIRAANCIEAIMQGAPPGGARNLLDVSGARADLKAARGEGMGNRGGSGRGSAGTSGSSGEKSSVARPEGRSPEKPWARRLASYLPHFLQTIYAEASLGRERFGEKQAKENLPKESLSENTGK